MEKIQDKLNSNKYVLLCKGYFQRANSYLKSEEGIRDIAMLPLFFNWVPILILKFEVPSIQKSCLYSMLFSAYFFTCLIGSIFLNMIPLVGSALAAFLHFVGVVLYIGLCGFFIYSYHRNKTLDLAVIDKQYDYLVTNLF